MAQDQTIKRKSPPDPPRESTPSGEPKETFPPASTPFGPPPIPEAIAPEPPPAPSQPISAQPPSNAGDRRVARRRPAGPSRTRIAANDDAPSIGGLIYALNQQPSNKPFVYAAAASGVWAALSLGAAWTFLGPEFAAAHGLVGFVAKPAILGALATILGPVALFWFLACLAWRTEDLRLRSTAMTEVAIRLAEPDRMAEQSIASLGQAVRRQVSFMNDAVERALGRAGELEALVHNEVTVLERSYDENERRIRGLIQELAGERSALVTTSERLNESLKSLGHEVPTLIDKLSNQQLKLTSVIEGAGHNLTALESSLAQQTGHLENALGSRTHHLQSVLEDYTSALGAALGSRTQQMQAMFEGCKQSIDTTLADRTGTLQTVFEEYARALDATLANRAKALDMQLVERTKTLDDAFTERLRLLDESMLRQTTAIDGAVGEKARALTAAMETHARTMSETIGKQALELDETLLHGVNAVRRTSENITRQSVKAIEGLANQSELLKNVSENLLAQISGVTNRFETQGQSIMRAANALESANYKIDMTLQNRHAELSQTLERLSGKAEELGQVMSGASTTIEGSLTEAELRARQLTHELTRGAEARSRSTMAEIERLRIAANVETDSALDELRSKFSSVSREVSEKLGSLQNQFTETTSEVRDQAARAAAELAREQARLRSQAESLPVTTRQSAEAVRKALQDQLRALEQLSRFNASAAAHRDVSSLTDPATGGPNSAPPPPERSRALSSLTSTLAQELGARQRQVGLPPPVPTANSGVSSTTSGGGDREAWSLGDLLARASQEEEGGSAPKPAQPLVPQPNPALNVDLIAHALDPATASAIWARFRVGQRGIMVRSIYSVEGRNAFDEVSRRYRTEAELQRTVNRYLEDFERVMRETEMQDPSGRLLHHHLVSDSGRVYLFLAHASGRLS
jgi:hypothetical protein